MLLLASSTKHGVLSFDLEIPGGFGEEADYGSVSLMLAPRFFLSHVSRVGLKLLPLRSAGVGLEACPATSNREAVFSSRKDGPTTPPGLGAEYSIRFLDLAAAGCQRVESAPALTWLPVLSVAIGK